MLPSAGEVEVLGMKWADSATTIRAKIGISLQETRLSDKLTVRETVALFRSFYPTGLSPDEAIARVEYPLAGRKIAFDFPLRRIDGRWYPADAVREAEHRLQAAASPASARTTGAR